MIHVHLRNTIRGEASPITARTLETLIRCASAHATRLSKYVTKEDCQLLYLF